MAVKIRLTRRGSTHHPFYRLVVADSRKRRDGRAVDTLGYYNPLPVPADIKVDGAKALDWLKKGALPSDTAKSLLKQTGVWQKFQLLKQGKSEEDANAEVAKILEIRTAKAAQAVDTVKAKQATAKQPPAAAEEPKAEEPKAEEPKAEEPKAEEPKAEEPKAEEPKAEEPAAESTEAEKGE